MTIPLKRNSFPRVIIRSWVSLDLHYGLFYRDLGETLAELSFRTDPEAIS